MNKSEFYYPSADGKTMIRCIEWTPENRQIFGVLQIAHGITEHIGRYESIARFFTDRGFAVIGNDHIGHGKSIAPDAPPLYFGPDGSWEYALEDVRSCRVIAGEHFGNLPHYLLGFSLGSFLVREYLARFPNTVDAAILVGTGQASPELLAIGKLLAYLEGKRVGEENTTQLIQKLAFGNYNRAFQPAKTDMDWLNSDENALEDYLSDPLCRREVSCGLFRELLDGMMFTSESKAIHGMCRDTPLLLLSGSDDSVGANKKGVKKLYKLLKRADFEDVTIKFFQGRHDILREKCSGQVLQYISDWMDSKML